MVLALCGVGIFVVGFVAGWHIGRSAMRREMRPRCYTRKAFTIAEDEGD